MYRLTSDSLRRLMAVPFAVSIPREPPASVHHAKAAAEDLGLQLLITVGDVVTSNVRRYWREPDVAIIDGRTRRYGIGEAERTGTVIDNPPATLISESFIAVRNAVEEAVRGRRSVIWVNGEEDLLAIPAVLESPVGSAVMYGLYTGYLVLVPVVPAYKLLMLKLLALMEPSPRGSGKGKA
ncbi:DUF359 domain-containing protein [Thermocladium modestius]|uniref:DUF359 domain-containing protein n=1 Tax=Thermocladium modestius TaxID=62609 RepID=UPI001E540774|nr:DUF359 domain-containing protein [Thermocladium modestius]